MFSVLIFAINQCILIFTYVNVGDVKFITISGHPRCVVEVVVGLLRVLVFPNLIDYDIGETTVKTTASVLTGFTCCLLNILDNNHNN